MPLHSDSHYGKTPVAGDDTTEKKKKCVREPKFSKKKKNLSESHSVSKLEFTDSREVTKSLIKYCFQNFLEKAKENIFFPEKQTVAYRS